MPYNTVMTADGPSLCFLNGPPSAAVALSALTPAVRSWFARRFGEPTEGQRLAWPAIASGGNLLLSAPTGSGKTLAAFLPVVGELLASVTGASVRCLYVAPLKALIADVGRNLRRHLRQIASANPDLAAAVRARARTGDTTPAARRRLLLEPPDILLTTPESLALLLSQHSAAALFEGLRWVVVDEVHALATTKRGADLSISLERLERLAGAPLQRIGLSATCAPLADAARFLVGADRPCSVAEVAPSAALELTIEPLFPPAADEYQPGLVPRLAERLEPELRSNRTTLVFANARGLAERIVWALRRRYPDWADEVAVHHSSLDRQRRRVAERDLKRGRLRCVVSSTSLELGIDVGAIDGVVLVHPPGGVVRLLQRVGRTGHRPDLPRRGLVLTAGAGELLEAAVTGASCRVAQYERLNVPAHPLDVLCQQLIGIAVERPIAPEDAFALVRRAYPYRELSRDDFDACVRYLCGLDADGREWLPPRLRRVNGLLSPADGRVARILWQNLGTILTEEQRPVRLADGGAVGEVDDAFAERLQPGDRFLLDGRCLELREASAGALLVEEIGARPVVPRWAGSGLPMSPELARRLYALRVLAAEALLHGPEALAELLRREYRVGGAALDALAGYFHRQHEVSEIPSPTTCLIECVRVEGGTEYSIHTELNRTGNDALARVLVQRLVRGRGRTAASLVADLGFLLGVTGDDLTADDWRALLTAEGYNEDLAAALDGSSALRERFRRVATTGFMLLRNPLGRKRRVGGQTWGEERLFEQVSAAQPDFVLLRQARREVRAEVCDGAAALEYLSAMPRRDVRCRWLAAPSPFASGWTQTTGGAVDGPDTPEEALERLHRSLVGEAV